MGAHLPSESLSRTRHASAGGQKGAMETAAVVLEAVRRWAAA